MRKAAGLFLLGMSTILGSAHALIDDGIVAKQNELPSVIRILTFTPGGKDAQGKTFYKTSSCTGTLITPEVVLTASHCLNTTPGVMQLVSLSGDSAAKLDRREDVIPVVGGIMSGAFKESLKNLEALGTFMKSEEFKNLTSYEQTLYEIAQIDLRNVMTAQDLAFLYLGNKQTGPNVKTSQLGCRSSLVDGMEVTIAGYGKKYLKDSLINMNEQMSLNYGSNVLAASSGPGKIYQINRVEGKQLLNAGDSGGPLFRKGDTSIVYGVASQRADNPVTQQGMLGVYANLSSPEARKFFDSVSMREDIPKSLKEVLEDCK